jgi:hypothetical protein
LNIQKTCLRIKLCEIIHAVIHAKILFIYSYIIWLLSAKFHNKMKYKQKMCFKSQLYGVKQKENNSYIYDRIDIFFNSDCIQSFILYNVGNFFKSWSK